MFEMLLFKIVVQRDVLREFLVDLIQPSLIDADIHRVLVPVLQNIVGLELLFV